MSEQNKQQKKKKNQEWKLAAEAKKLKKEQDRVKEKEKEKIKQKQNQKKQQKIEPTKQSKQEKDKKQQKIPIAEQKDPKQILPVQQNVRIKKSLQDFLPKNNLLLSNKNQKDLSSLRKLLLEYTHQFLKQQDQILLASTHQIIREWNQMGVGEIVDIWNISSKCNRKKNIIRTRFEDISYFKNTITKIVCGASYIFQNGLVASDPGTLYLAMLAYEYRIPFIILCQTSRYYDIALLEDDLVDQQIQYDLINPKYISLLITQAGPINASSIPTLVFQFYKQRI